VCVKRAGLVAIVLILTACGGHARYADLPPYRGYVLDDVLRRLHVVGLRASFPAASTPCGDGLPVAVIPSPRAPARIERGSTVTLKFMFSAIPSPSVPMHHVRWTHVPRLVGEEFRHASANLVAIWPCVHVRAATAISGTRLVVVAQSPRSGTRVPAFGVLSGRGYRPTTVNVTVEAQS